jgi:hypothetical protein
MLVHNPPLDTTWTGIIGGCALFESLPLRSTRYDVERAVAVVDGTSIIVRIELDDTGRVLPDRNTDESSVRLPLRSSKYIIVVTLHLTVLDIADEVRFAIEFSCVVPAGSFDDRLSAIIEAGATTVRIFLVVYSFAILVEDCVLNVSKDAH